MRINDCKIANNIRAFRYKTTEIYVHIAKEYCTNNFVSQLDRKYSVKDTFVFFVT